ncbi:MAG TPA: glycine betaine ABC transporter substrate-binding protein [Chloroflexota bacterium]|nr:glycine betaine ABC transporter substrate-binding protein [Chloroflexota bacterium]
MYVSTHITVCQVKRFLMAVLFLGASVLIPFGAAQATYAAHGHSKLGTIKIGEKNFAEDELVATMDGMLLQKAGFSYSLHQLGETGSLHPALLRGDIDMYPEYTGTGLLQLGYNSIVTNAVRAYDKVKTGYQKKFHVTWLNQSPMNDTNGVAVTKATASKYGLHTLSNLAKVASQLSFAEDPACKTRLDCLLGIEQKYGIQFKSVTDVAQGTLRYKGLTAGTYDVIEVFTTDPPIGVDHLVVLKDNKHKVFPADHIAPIVRDATLSKYPQIRTILNPLAQYLTTKVMINLNAQVYIQGKTVPAVARAFLKSKHLL